MNRFLLWNYDSNGYVAKPGSEHSFTKKLERARRFPTLAAAMAEKCGNECVHNLEDILRD